MDSISSDVPPANKFWVHDGKVLKNLQELKVALQKMSEDTYKFHANNNKNDFANWINDIYKNHELAQQMRTAKSRQDAARAIDKALNDSKKK